MRARLLAPVLILLAVVAGVVALPGRSGAAESFYAYSGSTPLSAFKPGAVLKTRTVNYHLAGIPLPVKVVQLLYRSTLQTGGASANVTSVIEPPIQLGKATRVVAYQSAYDSLNPDDGPSRAFAADRGLSVGQVIPSVEPALLVPELLQGIPVVLADTEGPSADFAAGPEYGMNTLDSLRAVLASATTGVSSNAKIALLGYSGGAIGSEWAAELAPSYAPDVNRHLVGAAMGGILVDPIHNLQYVDGSPIWSSVMPMAIVGIARAFHIDLTPYLSPAGVSLMAKEQQISILQAAAEYPDQTWAKLAKPQYSTPQKIPVLVKVANQLIMGAHGTPTVPLFMGQGANGILELTKPSSTYGPGDGVMLAGDVRSLAREYCGRGLRVDYQQYDLTSHVTSVPQWAVQTLAWLAGRFAGTTAPSSCGSIAAGNSLAPIPSGS